MMQTKTRTLNVTKFHTQKQPTKFQTSTILQETKIIAFQSFKKKIILQNILKHLTFSQDPTFASNKISVGKYYDIHLTNPDIILLMNRSIHPLSEASEAKFAARSRAERQEVQNTLLYRCWFQIATCEVEQIPARSKTTNNNNPKFKVPSFKPMAMVGFINGTCSQSL